jgi:hypothetical protein
MGLQGADGLFQGGLDTGLVRLPLPTVVAGALVLKTESDAAENGQTSSMMAISALSPRRGTVRMMRV